MRGALQPTSQTRCLLGTDPEGFPYLDLTIRHWWGTPQVGTARGDPPAEAPHGYFPAGAGELSRKCGQARGTFQKLCIMCGGEAAPLKKAGDLAGGCGRPGDAQPEPLRPWQKQGCSPGSPGGLCGVETAIRQWVEENPEGKFPSRQDRLGKKERSVFNIFPPFASKSQSSKCSLFKEKSASSSANCGTRSCCCSVVVLREGAGGFSSDPDRLGGGWLWGGECWGVRAFPTASENGPF